jgi:hypothetical protein
MVSSLAARLAREQHSRPKTQHLPSQRSANQNGREPQQNGRQIEHKPQHGSRVVGQTFESRRDREFEFVRRPPRHSKKLRLCFGVQFYRVQSPMEKFGEFSA